MKKGFTLVELLAVILILGILLIIILPMVTGVISSSRTRLFNIQIKNIELAAKNWAAENPGMLPSQNNESITIFLYNLKMGGFIEDDITNPLTGELFPNDMEIEITMENNKHVYFVDTESGTPGEEMDYNQIIIVLKGALTDEIEINSGFLGVSPNDIVAYAPDGTKIDSANISVTVREDGVVVENVDDSELNEYEIEYLVSYEALTAELERVIEIVDTIPPEIIFENPIVITEAVCDLGFDPTSDVSVTDNSGSYNLEVNGTLDCAAPTTNVLEYVATDPSNNVTTKERTIYVE